MSRRVLLAIGVLFIAACGWLIVAARAMPISDEGDDGTYPAHGPVRSTIDRVLFGVDYRVGVIRRDTPRK